MRILPDQTRIYQVREGTWALEIVWVPTFQILFTTVRVFLDRSMIAKAPQYQAPTVAIGLDVRGIQVGVPLVNPGLVVAENGAIVEFRIFEIPKSVHSTPTKTAKTILFEWQNPSALPPRIDLHLEITKPFVAPHRYSLTGYNIKEHLVEFVGARSDTRFHFPWDDSAIRFQPCDIYEQIPVLQRVQRATVWGVSGPHEVWFWRTPPGTKYLAEQVRLYKTEGRSYEPIRISLCPYDAQVDAKTRTAFLAEMQVQSDCGVKIMMTDQKSLEAIMGHSHLAIAVFGEALGVMYHEFQHGVDEGYILLALDQARLHELRDRFTDLYTASSGWERYKTRRSVKFTASRARAIKARREYILKMVTAG